MAWVIFYTIIAFIDLLKKNDPAYPWFNLIDTHQPWNRMLPLIIAERLHDQRKYIWGIILLTGIVNVMDSFIFYPTDWAFTIFATGLLIGSMLFLWMIDTQLTPFTLEQIQRYLANWHIKETKSQFFKQFFPLIGLGIIIIISFGCYYSHIVPKEMQSVFYPISIFYILVVFGKIVLFMGGNNVSPQQWTHYHVDEEAHIITAETKIEPTSSVFVQEVQNNTNPDWTIHKDPLGRDELIRKSKIPPENLDSRPKRKINWSKIVPLCLIIIGFVLGWYTINPSNNNFSHNGVAVVNFGTIPLFGIYWGIFVLMLNLLPVIKMHLPRLRFLLLLLVGIGSGMIIADAVSIGSILIANPLTFAILCGLSALFGAMFGGIIRFFLHEEKK
jgi:hypothetical protein